MPSASAISLQDAPPRAISIAYEAAEHIHFDKLHKRTDIGMRALKALAEKQ